jgi:hypothetical protein
MIDAKKTAPVQKANELEASESIAHGGVVSSASQRVESAGELSGSAKAIREKPVAQ